MRSDTGRVPVLYLAPWVDFGGSDKGTIDWFRFLDRERFEPSLITTQPSLNRRLAEIEPYAAEVWPLTEFFAGEDMPQVIFDFIETRGVQVLHLMNSRIGFDLLPDLAALPNPPAVVVQLHVEEQDKSGYVRYVTTRYGNLVNAFSLTSKHLADAVERYDVARSRCRVIYTGVDAEEEFVPERVEPMPGLDEGPVQLLYPGRLVEQKDPLLMVEVISALRERGLDFQIQVVGEGELEPDVRRAVSERGLDKYVRFHPPTEEIARWFAACDVLLMTSVFEGVPYVVYEAMAMGVPIVAPALPGNAELMDDGCGTLVSPRGHVGAYVEALTRLISDPGLREQLGTHARERVRENFSLQQMGDEHSRLYEELVAKRPPARQDGAPPAVREPIRLRNRPSRGSPLVSVVIPCFNHGRYLSGCLDSIRKQTYPAIETIVVDDASTDPHTLSVIDELSTHTDDVTVIRLQENGGPSIARNAALPHATGRYLLPVDADNLLLPDAVDRLVNQLQDAGEKVGFIYPNLQYFGARNTYFEAPDYNLHTLLESNFADTSSLLDRELFDSGLSYPEDIRLGHEDWDFALTLAEHEVYGEPAATKTLMYRKMGFTRSDLVEYGAEPFHELIVERHPELYSRQADIKARWSPALSVIPLAPIETEEERERLFELCARQGWSDFELLARAGELWPQSDTGPALRRLPADLARSPVDALETALTAARGNLLLVTAGNGLDLLEDRGFTAKLAETLTLNTDIGAIALTDAGEAGRFRLRLLGPDDVVSLDPHSVVWRAGADHQILDRLELRADDVIGGLVAALGNGLPLQWRHATRAASAQPATTQARTRALARQRPSRAAARADMELRQEIPAEPPQVRSLRRWKLSATWMPPDSDLICRHVSEDGSSRVITNHRTPPPRYALEYDLALVRRFALPGTSRLVRRDDGTYAALDPDEPVAERDKTLGFVEQAPLPLLDALVYGIHLPSGAHVLVAGPADPIGPEIHPLASLGYVDSYPMNPRQAPHAELPFRSLGLVRAVDTRARRHVYGIGELPPGELVGELGAIATEHYGDGVPVWIRADGRVVTDHYQPPPVQPHPRTAARYVAAPFAWSSGPELKARARSAARRALDVPAAVRGSMARGASADHLGEPAGYLSPTPAVHRVPLYSGVHPVTGDQLLTRWPLEATDMGYGSVERIGYMLDAYPLTREPRLKAVSVPWASRFGQNARRG